jgi:hypothetical protein
MSARARLITRRAALWSGLGVLAAGAGAAAGALLPARAPRPSDRAPQQLLDAQSAEQRLIAVQGTTSSDVSLRAPMAMARADHLAHLQAIRALLADFATGATTGPTPAPGAATREALRAAEAAAASAAAARAAALTGRAATVLASIAACEATHAELFR